jgi:hypothetical protein
VFPDRSRRCSGWWQSLAPAAEAERGRGRRSDRDGVGVQLRGELSVAVVRPRSGRWGVAAARVPVVSHRCGVAVPSRGGAAPLLSPTAERPGGRQDRADRPGEARRVCQACRLRSEVKVLSWGPDRGNPRPMWQGRGPELTGRPASAAVWRGRASVRAGLKEAVGAWRWRTRVKRRKASVCWVSWRVAAKPGSCWCRGRIGDAIAAKSQRLTLGDLLGPEVRKAGGNDG